MAMGPSNPPGSDLRRRIAGLPDRPGVYLFRDAAGRLLYVGKALSLRKRVASYFHPALRLPPRIAQLMKQVRDLEVRDVATETEALLLEAQLIKVHRPHYNVAFRDDKTYPMLKVTNEPFPRLLVTRRKLADGARYFGPFPDAGLMHEAVQFLRRVFPMRTCRVFPKTPCLEYHLGQCLAPCAEYINRQQYQRMVDDLVAFLEGRSAPLLKDLERRMQQAARDERFEEAARLRNQIASLSSLIAAKAKSQIAGPLEQLQTALKLPHVPHRIEAFDISNIFGDWAVGSLVVFRDAEPFRSHYRRFRIRTVQGIDDYQMMREVIRRRYSGTLAGSLPLPDLLLVDGGKGQLSAAVEELSALSLRLPVIGLAKRFEHIFTPGAEEPIVLLPSSPVLHLVQRVRDEAHRFAIRYHRRIRRGSMTASALDALPGVGPTRKRALLQHFGSVDALRRASPQEIVHAGRLPESLAADILKRLNTGGSHASSSAPWRFR